MTDTPDRSELRRRHVQLQNGLGAWAARCLDCGQAWPCDAVVLRDAIDSRDARIASLEQALDRLLHNCEAIFEGRAVRDWTETLAEARAALGSASGTGDDPRKGGSDDA